MADHSPRQVTAEALYGYGETLRFLSDRKGDAPCPGDLFLVEAAAEAPLEWLVIEEADPGNWKVIAADLCPMAGSADVTLSEEGWAGPVTLRCGVSTTLPAAALRPELRTGVVPPDAVEEVRRKVRAIRSGELRGTSWEQETDAEIEYQDWCSEVLQPAIETLELAWPTDVLDSSTAPLLASRREAAPASASGRFHGWQMAAAVLVTAGVTFLLGEIRPAHPPGQSVAGLSPQVNPQLEWFQPATDVNRGAAREILLKPQAEWLTIVLETFDPRLFPSYGVELEHGPDAELLWGNSQLQRQGASEVIFTLPASMLPPGAYLLRLSGHREGGTSPLEEFFFTVRSAD